MSSIYRLPDSATQLISSHGVIVTPTLLVKELLDNAIDARATSVEILISSDTISRVEVRDNGVGIHPDDFDALGRHGHTSKLRDIEELGNLVGKSLGFRGEALASVNSMASVAITTKTSTEPIATTFQLVPNEGGVLSRKSTSAPVGTTVSVTNLFGCQPVRQQIAVKEAKKTHDQIHELLRSYVMARPQLKIFFKVLSTQTRSWSYSPKPNTTVIEATLQLFGSEVTSNCLLKTLQASHPSTNGDSSARAVSRPATSNFVLEAILANPDVALQNVPKRHYFSVDGRPMNASRGVAKRLLKIYLDHLRLSKLVKDTSDCFIRLNICCPPGSYDANIEPSKDDVIFLDERAIEDAFGYICGEMYKPAAVGYQGTLCTANSQENRAPTDSSLSQDQSHQTHSSQAQPTLPDCAPQISQRTPHISTEVSQYDIKRSVDQTSTIEKSKGHEGSQKTSNSTSISFTPINARDHPGDSQSESPTSTSHQLRPHVVPEPPGSQETETGGERNVGDHLNPWVIAKMNGLSEVSPDTVPKRATGRSLTPDPPILRHIMAPPGDLDVPRSHQDMEGTKLPCLHRSPVPGGPYRSPMASPSGMKPPGVSVMPPNHSHTTRRRREHVPWTPPSSLEKHRYIDVSQRDFTHPPRADSFKQTQLSFGDTRSRRPRGGTQGYVSQVEVGSEGLGEREGNKNLNMQDMFSSAKKNLHYQLSQLEADQMLKLVQSGESQRYRQQPTRQRQPFSVLQTNTHGVSDTVRENREPIATTLPIGDPRAYLLRRQKSMAAEGSDAKIKKLSRLKSSLMPLENTPPEYQTRMLSLTISVGSLALNELVRKVRKYDEYVVYGVLVDGLDMSLSDGETVESQLQRLLTEQKENIGNKDIDKNDPLIIDLQAMLKGKSILDTTTHLN
ncbi:hypothetical protein F5Y12DRAFT_601604 [Xylaria sp. FL1777]|nr:hypothetical protein F5Y12DRAFT_601604 [Xylaria sp. FL1777]